MSEAQKHTPGPWHVAGQGDDKGNLPIKACAITIAGVNGQGTLADARLIAAAPDLLAACEAALNMVDGDGHPPAWDKLRAAIRRAKGGA